VVTDTGPALHLKEAGALELLRLAGEVRIAAAVDVELGQLDASWRSGRPAWIQVTTLMEAAQQEAVAWQQAGVLDAGEAETLALAQQVGADWVLTDDAAARLVARSLGRDVHGSLGVVLWAAATGHLNYVEAEATLERLVGSSLWMSARVVAEARAALREMFE
jgi:predicted nucleic acid-binding protein